MWAWIFVSIFSLGSSQCQLPICKSAANCPQPNTENPFLFDSVCLHDGTEFPFTGALLHNDYKGIYRCSCCNNALFSSAQKFDSGTGWPSFFDVYDSNAVTLSVDNSMGDVRTAVSCKKCGAHLGHVFDDGPAPTGKRYCINSVCLHTDPNIVVNKTLPPPAIRKEAAPRTLRKAVFAGGCFWGIELVFESIKGVENAVSGYAGGTAEEATYPIVSTGTTEHAESVEVTFDPLVVNYSQLLDVFFHVHDPTTLNYQMPDSGPQYRSAIFATNKSQKNQATKAKQLYQKDFANPIVTEINMLDRFYPAEAYHQDFARRNPQHGYIVAFDWPKFQAFKAAYPSLVKAGA